MNRFQNPNLLERLTQLSSDLGNIWTWSALILAAVAAFTVAIRQSHLIILRRFNLRTVIPHTSFKYDDSSCSSSDDDDDDDDEEEEEVDEEEEKEVDEEKKMVAEDKTASCSGDCGQDREQDGKSGDQPSWPDIGGAIVKAWDGLQLGLGFQSCGDMDSILLFDMNQGDVLRSFLPVKDQVQAVNFTTPAVLLSASENEGAEAATVRVWDARDQGLGPAATGEWQFFVRRRVVGIAGGEEGKVYVSDDTGTVSEVDLRAV